MLKKLRMIIDIMMGNSIVISKRGKRIDVLCGKNIKPDYAKRSLLTTLQALQGLQ